MRIWLSLAAASIAAISASAAYSQSLVAPTDFDIPSLYGRGKNTSVFERSRPEYQALGIPSGGFTLLPRVETSATSTDNVYLRSTAKKSDTYFTVVPSIYVRSNWSRHVFQAAASGNFRRYAKYSSENTSGWSARADGRIDVHGESFLTVGGDAQRVFEERGNIAGSQNNVKPVPVDIQGAYLRGTYAQDRVRAAVEGSVRNYNFINVSGNADQNGRDYDSAQLGGRVDVAISPDTAVFVKSTLSKSDYKTGTLTGATTDRRDNKDTRILGGANFDLTSLVRGEVGLGYLKREYDSKAFRSISGLGVSTKLEYFPSQLATVTFVAQRQIQDAAFTNSGGYFQNIFSLGGDLEARRNLILSAGVSHEFDNFKGVDRKDKVTSLALSGRYYVNNIVGVGLTLSNVNRSSSGANFGPEYKATKIGLSLVFQR